MLKFDEFLYEFNLSKDEFDSAFITWDELYRIGVDHAGKQNDLQNAAAYINNQLQFNESIHSVNNRVKNDLHLIEKIVRKNREAKRKRISIENYTTEITDLIGLRALHIFKEEWEPIHEYILRNFEVLDMKVYHKKGDSDLFLQKYTEKGLPIEEHRQGYRSIHYTIKLSPVPAKIMFAEIQVRSIFEEAWSEIDHRIKYPYVRKPQIYGQLLYILNGLSGTADEIGSFTNNLKKISNQIEIALNSKEISHNRIIEIVANSAVSEDEKNQLIETLSEIKFYDSQLRKRLDGAEINLNNMNSIISEFFSRAKPS